MIDAGDPTAIGPFVVLRKLGEGAMGVVYAGYDVALDRKVALKLVHRHLLNRPQVRTRMVREAQAMARLSSPYVVQVFQVGDHGDRFYLAMELIDGVTLRSWLKATRRPWRQVLRVFCDAGRGLAAAHAAGLVHRDFKPENVLVGADGRARVLDFGLVQTELEAATGGDDLVIGTASVIDPTQTTTDDALLATAAPVTGPIPSGAAAPRAIVGTPAYMAPEQHFSAPVGPRSDLFSFCVTLYEALYGARPFDAPTLVGLQAKLKADEVPPPPPDTPVPRRIFRALARGLALAPEQRWPDMESLVRALEHDPVRARLRVLGLAGLIGATAAISFAITSSQLSGPQRCQASAEAGLDGVWDPPRRAAVRAAITAIPAPFALAAADRVEARLDAYAAAWTGSAVVACESNTNKTESDRILDLRMACLGQRRARMRALVDALERADRDAAENAVQAAAALPRVDSCEDVQRLLAAVPPPEDPAAAAAVEAARQRLALASALESLGHYQEGLALTVAIESDIAALDYPPLDAEAALLKGTLELATSRPEDAERSLALALAAAIRSDQHLIAAEAAARRLFVLGAELARFPEALAEAPYAAALVDRAGEPHLAALMHNNLGAVHDLRGDDTAAAASYQRTLELLTRSGPSLATDHLLAITHNNIGCMQLDQGDYQRAAVSLHEAERLLSDTFGPDHPLLAHPISSSGEAAFGLGDDQAALRSFTRALTLMEASYSRDNIYLISPLTGLGLTHLRMGDRETAATELERANALGEREGRPIPQHAEALTGLAQLAQAAGSADQAKAYSARAATIFEATLGPTHPKTLQAAANAAP
ncbi:MAG: protein kinase [Nannocystis sp.]|nr:protein kinase [Nannocystis sp.]